MNNTIENKEIVSLQNYTLTHHFELESGEVLENVNIAYETYGKLNSSKDNAIIVFHALTGDAHAAFYNNKTDKKPGWWNDMIGSGKAFDTDKYFIVCSNILGGCKGTTGPSSINPKTNKPYGLSFPIYTIEDAVRLQKELIDYLGIKKIIAAGGSMGGMMAQSWAIMYPEMVKGCIIIASTSRLSPQAIAFNAVSRNAILSDENFNNGDYYKKEHPEKGLSIARMVGHITYLCEEAMKNKFGRQFLKQNKDNETLSGVRNFDFQADFQVESYLHYQGQSFVNRFDANSYLYITKAVDYFDLTYKYGTLSDAFKNSQAKFLIISFSSDWLFTTSQAKEIVNALVKTNKNVSFCEIDSPCGHDAFLLEFEAQTKIIKGFL
ncbi:MAG: homoserine O-acetyltransferase [Candidatus Melainabacteria bacterium LEY3_CP_29_8]|nr:MAG: homoserine O-acetyltransferase [Candidatus Melainabacteria bacterium LEY3_CP_29_8]